MPMSTTVPHILTSVHKKIPRDFYNSHTRATRTILEPEIRDPRTPEAAEPTTRKPKNPNPIELPFGNPAWLTESFEDEVKRAAVVVLAN